MNINFECYACPVCGQPLNISDRCLRCEKGHSFDFASQGYVNLLMSGHANAGDNKMMVNSRHEFLERGYFGCLSSALQNLTAEICARESLRDLLIVDAGCGEGYYTVGVDQALAGRELHAHSLGFDISKSAVKVAAKRGSGAAFAVASAFEMPLRDSSADIMLSIFAPLSTGEFQRVIKPGGSLVIVAPGKRHLFGMKEILYENPYENAKNEFEINGFELVQIKYVSNSITLSRAEDISSLFEMTPYYWKTPAEGCNRLKNLGTLVTEIEFELHELKRL